MRRQRSFPGPVEVEAADSGEQDQDENEEQTFQSGELTAAVAVFPIRMREREIGVLARRGRGSVAA